MRFMECGLSCFDSLCQPFLTHYQPSPSISSAPFVALSCMRGSQEKKRSWIESGDMCDYRLLLPGVTSVFGTWFIHEAIESGDL